MTKQEKIQKEYEKLGLPFNENIIYDNGWLKIKPGQYSSKYDDLDLLKLTNHVHSIRPKSLKGIEENNGWTKLKGIKNEITHNGDIWILNKYGNIELWLESQFLLIGYATHYKPIVKPKPPIW